MFRTYRRAALKTISVLLATLLAITAAPFGSASAQGSSEEAPKTIAEIAVETPALSTLVTALTIASENGPVNFLDVASNPDADLTVFAPTNAAFDALGDTLTAALNDPSGLLTNVLLYHILDTSQTSDELLTNTPTTTLLGQDITIETRDDGNVYINNARVELANIEAANGIVHVIDAVLLPPPPPVEDPVFDGAHVNLVSAFNGKFLDGDRGYFYTNVDSSNIARADDIWVLEATNRGTWRLENAKHHLYLDADSARRHYNVDLGRRHFRGTEWEITKLDNGNYALRSVAYDRFLDLDRYNVDTGSTFETDNEWQIVIADK